MEDGILRQLVVDELEYEPSIDAAHIGVAVEHGIVTLSGHVANYGAKIAAEHAALRVEGVLGLAQEIDVRYPGSRSIADDEIVKRCLDVLAWDASLPMGDVRVKVEKGWVCLTGKMSWQYQREAAETSIRKLAGVVGVSNLIEVHAPVEAADISKMRSSAMPRSRQMEFASSSTKVR